MAKPRLYIALEGPLALPDGKISDYARPFLHWAKQHFDVTLVTDGTTRQALQVLAQIGEQLPIRTFVDTKASLLKPQEDYFWVDAELIPSEVSFLAQHGHHNRFFQTDANKGVTVDLKNRIEARLRTRKRKYV